MRNLGFLLPVDGLEAGEGSGAAAGAQCKDSEGVRASTAESTDPGNTSLSPRTREGPNATVSSVQRTSARVRAALRLLQIQIGQEEAEEGLAGRILSLQPREVEEAYRRRARQVHPDRAPGNLNVSRIFPAPGWRPPEVVVAQTTAAGTRGMEREDTSFAMTQLGWARKVLLSVCVYGDAAGAAAAGGTTPGEEERAAGRPSGYPGALLASGEEDVLGLNEEPPLALPAPLEQDGEVEEDGWPFAPPGA